jgi:Secretion system C-terminal sorting domain
MRFIQISGICVFLLLGFYGWGQVPYLEMTLRFNPLLSRYEVYALPNATNNDFNLTPSQLSIVVPATMPNNAFSIISNVGGSWQDNTQVLAPAADPLHDFHGIGSSGAMAAFEQGVEKLMFYFSLPGGICTPGLRLFVNGQDPNSSAPGMNGSDFSNSIFAIVPEAPDGYEAYIGNYDNNGTVCLPMPLELTAFNTSASAGSVYVTWQTLNEWDFCCFELQRSVDGGDFIVITRINSDNKGAYNYADKNIEAGVQYFYRLSMIDIDGRFIYSDIRNAIITTNGFAVLGVAPNPVRNSTSIEFYTPDDDSVIIKVADVSGNLLDSHVFKAIKGKNIFEVDLANYTPGLYWLSLNNGKELITKKVLHVE